MSNRPDPGGGAYSAPPVPLAGFGERGGKVSQGREREEGRGRRGRKRDREKESGCIHPVAYLGFQ